MCVKPVSRPTTCSAWASRAAASPTFRKGGTWPSQLAAMRSASVCSASLPHITTGSQPLDSNRWPTATQRRSGQSFSARLAFGMITA